MDNKNEALNRKPDDITEEELILVTGGSSDDDSNAYTEMLCDSCFRTFLWMGNYINTKDRYDCGCCQAKGSVHAVKLA